MLLHDAMRDHSLDLPAANNGIDEWVFSHDISEGNSRDALFSNIIRNFLQSCRNLLL
jgi:hypothetical protein